MMRNVTGVMKESLERAKAYVVFTLLIFFSFTDNYILQMVLGRLVIVIQRDK